MLRSHPHISLPSAESHFFVPFYNRRNEFGDLSNKTVLKNLLTEIYHSRKIFFDTDLHGIKFNIDDIACRLLSEDRRTIPDIISGIFEMNAMGEGKLRWGDKTPYYVLHLPTILEMFPQAQIIHIIRDGRDCALSMLERRMDLQIFNTYHAAHTWNKYVSAGMEFGKYNPSVYLEIKYEEILSDPHLAMHTICDFLSEEFVESLIEFRKPKAAIKTHMLQKPIQQGNQEKWRSKMTNRQIRIFEAMAGETLKKQSYELSIENPSVSAIESIFSELQIRFNYYKAANSRF